MNCVAPLAFVLFAEAELFSNVSIHGSKHWREIHRWIDKYIDGWIDS